MASLRRRQYILAGLLAAIAIVAAAILWTVLEVVFFAITIAYVLYPIRQRLVNRGVSRRIASILVTTLAFLAVVILLAPLAWALFRRRQALISLLQDLPDELPLEIFGITMTIDVAALVDAAAAFLRDLAGTLALSAPEITLQLALFTFLLYGLLLRPTAVGRAAFQITPPAYHDILRALHQRVIGTLYALYIIQAATAVVTFPIAFIVFFALGYEDAFVLSVLAAILQFIPIVGPGILAVGLAGYDLLIGNIQRSLAIIILGPLLIGLLPDVLIRPRLASSRARLPASLYFVGFVGGVLTVGIIGVIAGPLIVALLVEVINLLSEGQRAPEE